MITRYNDELAGDMVGKGFRKKLKKKLKKIPKPVKVALNPMSVAKYAPIKNKRLKTLTRLAMGDVTAIPSAVKDKKLLKAAINPVSALPIKSDALKAALGDPFAAASLAKKAAFGGGGGSESVDDSSIEESATTETVESVPSGIDQSYDGSDDGSDIVFASVPAVSSPQAQSSSGGFSVNDDDEGENNDLVELSGEMVGSIFKSIKKGVKKVAKGTAKVATSKAGIAALSFAGGAGAAVAATKIAQSGVIQNFVKNKFGGKDTSPGYASQDVSDYMSTLYAQNDEAKAAAAPIQDQASTPAPVIKAAGPRVRSIPASMMTSSDATPGNSNAAMFGGFDLKKMALPLVLVGGAFFLLRGRA